MEDIKKQFAFTLAEILITLGIIGIVAAMTIPNLIYKYRIKAYHSKFNKVYSELNQMSKLYLEQNEQSIPAAVSNGENMGKILNTYLKGMGKVNNYTWSSVDEEGNKLHKKYNSLSGAGTVKNYCDVSGLSTTIAGTGIYWNDAPRADENGPVICIDLDGEKGANRAGFDYFLFFFTLDGAVLPMGAEHPDNAPDRGMANNFWRDKSNCYNSGENVSCAYWAARDVSPRGNGTYWDDFLGKKLYK